MHYFVFEYIKGKWPYTGCIMTLNVSLLYFLFILNTQLSRKRHRSITDVWFINVLRLK